MERRTLLAVILSIIVIMIFQFWMVKRYPQQPATLPAEKAASESQLEGRLIVEPKESIQEKFVSKEEEYIVETDRFIITFSNLGGSIKRIDLKEFQDPETGIPLELVKIKDPQYYVGAFNLIEEKIPDIAVYQLNKAGDKISYHYTAPNNIEIKKIYTVYNNSDYIDLHVIIKNSSQGTIATASRIIAASYINSSGYMASRYINVSAKMDGKIFRERRDSLRAGDVSWVALSNKYFCVLLRPYQPGRKAITNLIEKDVLLGGIETGAIVVSSGAETTQQYLFYIGPLDVTRLKTLELGLEEAVNYGVFDGIAKILTSTLRFFYKVMHNWGVAIICLTVLVNVILYPLTKKSYKSMKAMQLLQPQIDKLRTLHKNNPHRLNRELMELYRKYKVNPLGGCLPLLLQMPIFIALYHALLRSIELKGANFIWIKDLSKPDAVKLPLSLPILGDSINLLPILMMIAMIVQQKIASPQKSSEMSEQQRQQQTMMILMPAVFVIIFYSLPSGLVLYWLVNTVLMSLHQYRIKKLPVSSITNESR